MSMTISRRSARSLLFSCVVSLTCACASPRPAPAVASDVAAPATPGEVREGTPAGVDIVQARALGREQGFVWQDWSADSFTRAKQERRFILVHGAAGWCHWCHVMEETTYRHPKVGKRIAERFVAIRVDIDARPDIQERYEDWGWPATILLSPDGEELGKYRGFMTADEMLARLTAAEQASAVSEASNPHEPSALPQALPWVGALAARQMDNYYDADEGGWGHRQKAPIGDNATFELRRYAKGKDRAALERALFSLRKQAALIDPVWGGIYQYSAASDWNAPHYEKLMTYQASNLWAYADAYRLSRDPSMLKHAQDIARYMTTLLSSPDGGFYTTQDADVGSHDRNSAFVDGDVYYRLNDAERRKRGIPHIDTNVYAYETGLAIAALCALYEATGDAAVLARAEKAALRLLTTHVDSRASVHHAAGGEIDIDVDDHGRTLFLNDAASFGFALARIAEVRSKAKGVPEDRRFALAAQRVSERMLELFVDPRDGGLWANTPDPDAHGVFARRRKPYAGAVNAARLLAALDRLNGLGGPTPQRAAARRALAAFATPKHVGERGRMIGGYLLALDEVDALVWVRPGGSKD